jgi:hypothetical protein
VTLISGVSLWGVCARGATPCGGLRRNARSIAQPVRGVSDALQLLVRSPSSRVRTETDRSLVDDSFGSSGVLCRTASPRKPSAAWLDQSWTGVPVNSPILGFQRLSILPQRLDTPSALRRVKPALRQRQAHRIDAVRNLPRPRSQSPLDPSFALRHILMSTRLHSKCPSWCQSFWLAAVKLCSEVRTFRAFCLHAEPQTRLYWG